MFEPASTVVLRLEDEVTSLPLFITNAWPAEIVTFDPADVMMLLEDVISTSLLLHICKPCADAMDILLDASDKINLAEMEVLLNDVNDTSLLLL
jgi:hypothetical protein